MGLTNKGETGPRKRIMDRSGFWEVLGVVARLGPIGKTKIEQEAGSAAWRKTKSRVDYLLKSRRGRDDNDMIKSGLFYIRDEEYTITLYGLLTFLTHDYPISDLLNPYVEIDEAISNFSKICPQQHEVDEAILNFSKMYQQPELDKVVSIFLKRCQQLRGFFKLWEFIRDDNHKEWAYKSLRQSAIWSRRGLDERADAYKELKAEWVDIDIISELGMLAYNLINNYRGNVGDSETDEKLKTTPHELRAKLIKDDDIKQMMREICDSQYKRISNELSALKNIAYYFNVQLQP